MIYMKLKKLVKIAGKKLICYFFWCCFRCFPLDCQKVVLCSYYGRGYGDNPKYIAEQLITENTKLKMYWLLKDMCEAESLPERIIPCLIDSPKGIYHLSTAKVWIDNCRKNVLFKRKSQIYIQTWHGFALKKIEKDAADSLSPIYIRTSIKDSQKTDLILSDSTFMTGIYRQAFWYTGEVSEWGSPRNDIIINRDIRIKQKVYKYFSLACNKRIVMYAPTFRKDYSIHTYTLDYEKLRLSCEARFGGNFVVFIRLHPNIVSQSKNLEFDCTYTFDASLYPDMQELLVATDVVVTDYSSLMFDFAMSGKPCFQFATDIESYKEDRNFYFELNTLPFALGTTNDELSEIIKAFDAIEYKNQLSKFFLDVGMIFDGKASERTANYIIDICKKK